MGIGQFLTAAFVGSMLLAIGWVAFWNFIVPSVFFGWTWAGHDALIGPVFFAGLIGGPLALAATFLNR